MAWTTSTWSPSLSSVLVPAARHDVQVQFHRHLAAGQLEPAEQGRDALARGQFVRFTVQLNAHAHGHHCSLGQAF
jgi:hypothetical protein